MPRISQFNQRKEVAEIYLKKMDWRKQSRGNYLNDIDIVRRTRKVTSLLTL